MTDIQLILALPSVLCLVVALAGVLINNSRLSETNAHITELRLHMDRRFDDMQDRWRGRLG